MKKFREATFQNTPEKMSLYRDKSDKVFKIALSKFCGRQPLKNLKGYGLLKQIF